MFNREKLPLEDEFIIKVLHSFTETIELWYKSNQKERIPSEVDKTACILTAYMYGRMENLI